MKANASVIAESGVAVQNRSSTLAAQTFFGTWKGAYSRIKPFFNGFRASNTTIPRTPRNCSAYSTVSLMLWWCLSSSLSSTMRPSKAYVYLTSYWCLSCEVCKQGCCAPFLKEVTNIRTVSVSGNASKFQPLSSASRDVIQSKSFLCAIRCCFRAVPDEN